MNGFADHGLDEDAFGEKGGSSIVKAFDAFRKSRSALLYLPIHPSIALSLSLTDPFPLQQRRNRST